MYKRQIAYDLLFERFLNPDRISLPDIDVDFADDGRGRVLNWVTEQYGQEKVAHIITYGTMATKLAIDVYKRQVLDLRYNGGGYENSANMLAGLLIPCLLYTASPVSCGGVDPAHWMASRYWLNTTRRSNSLARTSVHLSLIHIWDVCGQRGEKCGGACGCGHKDAGCYLCAGI